MNTYTKEEFEKMNAPEPTPEEKRSAAMPIAKRVYDWQEKQGIYAFDAEACEAGCDVRILPTFNAYHTPENSAIEEVAEFRRTEDCADNEGICGDYKLISMRGEGGTWRIEKVSEESPEKPLEEVPS